MSFSLYELTGKYLELVNYIESNDSEDVKAFDETLESLEDSIEDKAHNIVGFIKSIDTEIKGLKKEKERIAQRISSRENKIARMKEYLQEQLELTNTNNIRTSLFTIWIQNNPKGVHIENETDIPARFLLEQKPKIDRVAILEALNNKEEVGGAKINQTRSIRFR